MIIVADSGSTKTDWKIINGSATSAFSTMGFNPVLHSEELVFRELNKEVQQQKNIGLQAEQIYFYGAGCWDAKRKGVIRRALSRVFQNASIKVDHDLLAAARATCGTEPGIACILGTGSNSCLYDGKNVIDNVTNLGYQVGDEGSGSHIGKELVRCYFYRELPDDLLEVFEEYFPGGRAAILDNVYEGDAPNVYLASFTRFMSQHKDHFFIQKILYNSFASFIDRHVRKYAGHTSIPVHFVGSVGYHFQKVIQIALEERNMTAGLFIQKPIERLVDFHRFQMVKPVQK